MKAKLKNIIWILVFCFLIFTAVSAIFQRASGVLSPTVWNCGLAFVKTGSMEPSIPVGSLILIHKQDNYCKDDVITYIHESGNFTVTHRIVYIEDDVVVTQGDANNTPDPPFAADRVIGKVVLTIPYLGFAVVFIQKPMVLFTILGFIVLLIFFDDRNKKSGKKNPEIIQ